MAKLTLKAVGTANGMDSADTRKAWDEARRPHKRNATEHTGQSIRELYAIVLAWLSDVGEAFAYTERDELVELASQAIGNPFNRSMIRVILALYFCGYKSAERISTLIDEYTVEIGQKALLLVNARDMVGKLFTAKVITVEVMRTVFAKLASMLTGELQVESKNHAYRVTVKAILTESGYEFPEGSYLLDSQLTDIIDHVRDSKNPSIKAIALIARAYSIADLKAEFDRQAAAHQAEVDKLHATVENMTDAELEAATNPDVENQPVIETPVVETAPVVDAVVETPNETPVVETGKGKGRNRKAA